MHEQHIRLTCRCGRDAEIVIKSERWLPRDEILRRARCSVCGRKGAENMQVLPPVGTIGMGR